jgi:hypothetical protein
MISSLVVASEPTLNALALDKADIVPILFSFRLHARKGTRFAVSFPLPLIPRCYLAVSPLLFR